MDTEREGRKRALAGLMRRLSRRRPENDNGIVAPDRLTKVENDEKDDDEDKRGRPVGTGPHRG